MSCVSWGQSQEPAPKREIMVPFEDLHVLLEGQPRRVLLSRQEFEELVAKASQVTAIDDLQPPAVVAAEYAITIGRERAEITGTLTIDTPGESANTIWQPLGLDLAGVGLRSALLGDQDAAIGLAADGRPTLFISGAGRQTLKLQLVSPVETSAALQMLNLQLPSPAAASISATVPGNVEIKSGAAVVSRDYDERENVTRFVLLPARGAMSLVMTLNNRQKRTERVVVARSVIVDEVTTAYERLHATVSFAVLHQAVDSFRLAVPPGFEITTVASPAVARWATEADGERNVLNVFLREATNETVVLTISAIRTPPAFAGWTLPQFEPLDVAGHVAVVGLLAEERWQVDSLVPSGLIPIDNSALVQALPESVFQAEPGAPRIRPVAAYYAAQGQFSLSAAFHELPAKLLASSNVLLLLADSSLLAHGGFALRSETEPLFGFEFSAPAGWKILSVSATDGSQVPFEVYTAEEGGSRIKARLPQPVLAGAEASFYFHAESTPAGWLGDWRQQRLEFPVFAVADAARDSGAIAVAVSDDLTVLPAELTGLIPLDDAEKAKFGLTDTTQLAYRYETHPYTAALLAERIAPRITARTYAFFKLLPEGLQAHFELAFDVQEARARQLQFRLPASTPAALDVRGLDGMALKEFSSTEDGASRIWTATLAEARRGLIRLRVTFHQPLPDNATADVPLPMIAAEGVEYQSGYVAVEGHADLEVEVTAHAAAVDIGELADADYQPGRRLVGAFGFVGLPAATTLRVVTRDGLPLPAAIVERAELVTVLSNRGVSQSVARFLLRTKTSFLEAKLPPGSILWSAELDDNPVKPQRQGDSLLVSLPAINEAARRDLRIVYETPIAAAGLRGEVALAGPRLLLRSASDTSGREVPLADLEWKVFTPSGYRLLRADGSVTTGSLPPQSLAVANVANFLYWKLGGVRPGYWLPSPLRSDRDSARATKSAPMGGRAGGEARYQFPTSEPPMTAPMPGVAGPAPGDMDESFRELNDMRRRDAEMDGEMLDDAMPMEEAPQDALFDEAPAPKADQPQMQLPQAADPFAAPEAADAPQAQAAEEGRPSMNYWALQGVRSLRIDLARVGEPMVFQSLGDDPRVELTLANHRRLNALAVGLAMIAFLIGLAMTFRSASAKAKYVVGMAIVTTLLPLLFGNPTLTWLCNSLFYAAAALAAYYLLAGCLRWCAAACCPSCCRTSPRQVDLNTDMAAAKTATAVMTLVLATGVGGFGQEAQAQQPGDGSQPIVVQVVPPPAPVNVPEDAIIVPYDPDKKPGEAGQVLVPYARFVELWNKAYPDEQLDKQPPPAPYALAGGAFQATLTGDEYLLIEGRLDLEILAEGFVSVPLPLAGGVLAKADVDGKPAKLGVLQAAAPDGQPPQQQAANAAAAPAAGQSLLVLYASGKGRHRVDLAVRIKLERRGGWRVASGQFPAAPASSLKLNVPDAGTEVRLQGVRDRTNYETAEAGETIETALSHDQTLSIQWRPKVAEGVVDRGLTVQSTSQATVQEDGVRLVWRLKLEFRRSQRDGFTLHAPAGYLVERVAGQNVRGWEAKAEEADQRLEVTLLKPARDEENLVVYLWRAGASGLGEMAQLDIPQVGVEGAQLHAGQVTIHRSPLLELRTVETTGVSRTDLAVDGGQPADASATGLEESPLGSRPFAAFRFSSVPFSVRLAVEPVLARVSGEFQTLLRVAERQRQLETRLLLRVDARPLYTVRVAIPDDLEIDSVTAPGNPEWGVTEQEGSRVLELRLASGQLGEFAVLIRGRLGELGPIETLPLPKLEVLDIGRQETYIVVQPDPAFAVAAENLRDCETVLASRVEAWMGMAQRRLAQLNIHCRDAGYSGELRISPRQPLVTCNTISNVRVTSRTIEETILLDFNIRDAGIREVAFLLPPWMKRARIQGPQVRQKTVTETGEGANAPLRVRLQLQDEVMGQYRVLIENDRLLTADAHDAPIPTVETGRTERRFVAFESAGRGEVVVERQEGLSPLGRQQQEWRTAAAVLGDRLTQAYLVETDAAQPRLSFRSQQRQAVETVGARIGLAQCLLTLDEHGAYRATQSYRLENSTEQYLELELPDGAELWTARVDGQPVKPVEVPQAPRRARIPLLKTTLGDADYEVAVKYGGRMAQPGGLAEVRFPFIRTVNINAELSQVRLFLPASYRWFDFGGNMRLVSDQGDLQAGELMYFNRQLEKLVDATKVDDSYARIRAANNLKQLANAAHGFHDVTTNGPTSGQRYQINANPEWQKAINSNTAIVQEANEQIMVVENEPLGEAIDNNGGRLNEYFNAQRQSRAKNVAGDVGRNFDDSQVQQRDDGQPADGKEANGRFNAKWFGGNQLKNNAQPEDEAPAKSRVYSQDERKPTSRGDLKPSGEGQPDAAAQPQSPRFGQADVEKKLQELNAEESANKSGEKSQSESQTLQNYRGKVARQQAQQQGQGGIPNGSPNMDGQPNQQIMNEADQVQDFGAANLPPAQAAGIGLIAGGGFGGGTGNAPLPGGPTGLASLDVAIPTRGLEVSFTTPRGDVEITARAVPRPLFWRLAKLAGLAAALLIVWLVWGRCGAFCRDCLASRHATTLLIVLSILSILIGIFPIAGLWGLIAGVAIKLRNYLAPAMLA
ncbi:MAG: hypothetical protein AB7O62_15505 [Pirellulales bacterium]